MSKFDKLYPANLYVRYTSRKLSKFVYHMASKLYHNKNITRKNSMSDFYLRNFEIFIPYIIQRIEEIIHLGKEENIKSNSSPKFPTVISYIHLVYISQIYMFKYIKIYTYICTHIYVYDIEVYISPIFICLKQIPQVMVSGGEVFGR